MEGANLESRSQTQMRGGACFEGIPPGIPAKPIPGPLFDYLSLDDQFFCFRMEGRYQREALASLKQGSPYPVRKLLQRGERL